MTQYQIQRMEFLLRIAYANNAKLECALCGFDDIRALTGGHKNSDGNAHFHELVGRYKNKDVLATGKIAGFFDFLKAIRKRGWLVEDLLRMHIECSNCNTAKQSTFRFVSDWDINKIRAKAEGRIRRGMAKGPEARRKPAGREENTVTGTIVGGEGSGGRDESTRGSVRGSDGCAADLDDRQRERIDSTDWGSPPCVLGQ